MAVFNIPVFVEDGKAFTETIDRLYEACEKVGIHMDKRYEEFKNTQKTGKYLSIGQLVQGIADGKYKVSK